jgi:hypothetical protein
MHLAIRLLAIPILALGCQHAGADDNTPTPKKTDQVPLSETMALLPAIKVDSLTLTPVVATEAGLPKQDLDVVTLDEAFGQKLVTIKEQASESVNQLTLTNQATRPLFLLAGEVILGGKQDRIIGANTIIAANTTQVVPVFCVEHGRWTKQTDTFASAGALAHGRLRAKASFADQGEVWREVAAKNALRKTENATGTYRDVANQQANGSLASGSEKQVEAALAKILPDDRSRMIGYVVALNGKIATVDMFDSPKLFGKLEGKLLRSYLTESVDVPAGKTVAAPTVADVKAFMADADKAVAEKAYENPAASTIRYKGAGTSDKSTVELKPTRPDAKAKAVYKSYQSK